MTARPSDLAADGTGGAYFTQQTCVLREPERHHRARRRENLRVNGIVLSPDDKQLYVTNDASIACSTCRAPASWPTSGVHESSGRWQRRRTRGGYRRQPVCRGRARRADLRPAGEVPRLIPTPPDDHRRGLCRADRKTLYVTVQSTPTRMDGRWRQNRLPHPDAGAGTAEPLEIGTWSGIFACVSAEKL